MNETVYVVRNSDDKIVGNSLYFSEERANFVKKSLDSISKDDYYVDECVLTKAKISEAEKNSIRRILR